MNRTTRWAVTTALVLTAGFGLTSCGNDEADPDPERTVSTPGPSDDVETGSPLTQEEFGQAVTAAMLDAGSVHVVLDMAGTVGEGDMAVAIDQAGSAMSLMINDVELILSDGVFYVNLGQVSGGMYLSVTPGAGGRFDTSFAAVVNQADPVSQWELFDAAMLNFETTDGSEQVDGVATTQYLLTVDPAQVLSAEQVATAGGTLPESLTVTYYVGADNLPRRVTTEIGGDTIVIDYTAWGVPVSIDAPPAEQVADGAAFGL